MPLVSVNDSALHDELRIRVAQKRGLTQGKLLDLYTRIGLDFRFEDMSVEEIKGLKELIKKEK